MTKHGPKPDISHQELEKIARIVLQYLEFTESYDTDGLLRIAANESALVNLTKELTKLKDRPADITAQLEKQFIGKNSLSAHDYVGVLKRAFKLSGNLALVSKHQSWDTMRNALKITDFNEPEQVNDCLETFDLAIKALYESNEPQDHNAAQVLHTLLHIATKIADRASANQMTPSNCAIVVGPSIGELLAPPNTSNPLEMYRLMSLTNDLTEHLIASRRFALPLEKKNHYLGMLPAQIARELDKNTVMIAQLKKQIEQEAGKKGLRDSVARYKQAVDELSAENALFSQLLQTNRLSPRSRSDSSEKSSSSKASNSSSTASPVSSNERSEVDYEAESERSGKNKHHRVEKSSSRIHLVNKHKIKSKGKEEERPEAINDPKGKEEERSISAPPHKKGKKPK